MYITYWKQ